MITIRKANSEDFTSVLDLIKELAKFENEPNAVINTVAKMEKEQDSFYCLVAETDNKSIVGMAIYYHVYYTWVGKSMYLDDLYVKEEYRGKQIGTKLLKRVYQHAIESDCNRLRWQVLDWNTPAIDFYKKIGARLDGEWINCDVKSNEMMKYIDKY